MLLIDGRWLAVFVEQVPVDDDAVEAGERPTRLLSRADVRGADLGPHLDPVLVVRGARTLTPARQDHPLRRLAVDEPAHGIVVTALVILT